MLSSRLMAARPVRMDAISCCRSVIALSMRVFMLASTSFAFVKIWVAAGGCASVFMALSLRNLAQEEPALRVNHGADGLAHRHSHYIACCIQIENDNREFVVPAHCDRCGIHYSQALREHL